MQTIPLLYERHYPLRSPRRLRVLVALPDPGARGDIARYLRIIGLEVIGTDDGTDAVTLAVAADPHVLVVAAGLRGTDGFTVIRKLRSFKRTRHLPVVLYAAHS